MLSFWFKLKIYDLTLKTEPRSEEPTTSPVSEGQGQLLEWWLFELSVAQRSLTQKERFLKVSAVPSSHIERFKKKRMENQWLCLLTHGSFFKLVCSLRTPMLCVLCFMFDIFYFIFVLPSSEWSSPLRYDDHSTMK